MTNLNTFTRRPSDGIEHTALSGLDLGTDV